MLPLAPILLAALAPGPGPALPPSEPPSGTWRAWLDSPGGELPFVLELSAADQQVTAAIVNGPERIAVPETRFEKDTLVLEMPHYDSRIEARLADGRLDGTWRKRRGPESWTEMAFHATPGPAPRFRDPAPATASVDGRWSVDFASSDEPAVGLFGESANGVTGTFLTTTGDYRFLAGDLAGKTLRLSCFDGAHAFLFVAKVGVDGSLAGDFWSRDAWHETWTARRDPEAALPDPYAQTSWREGWSLDEVVFPDTEGRPRSLADPEFGGKARLLQVFGTWCPNCHDETRYLVELHERYRSRGLSILGLAFELTGDPGRNARQVRRFVERHGVRYPILVAGMADKEQATRAFPALDFVRSYPTTIFLHSDGRVRAVHSGFTGPATGDAHDAVRAEFEALIEDLLAEGPPGAPAEAATWAFLEGRSFETPLGHGEVLRHTFAEKDGRWVRTDRLRAGTETLPGEGSWRGIRLSGPSVFFAGEVLRVDLASGVLLDPRRFERRYVPPSSPTLTPSIDARLREDEDALVALVGQATGSERREAIVAVADLRLARGATGNPHVARWLADDSLEVVLAATWAAGVAEEESARATIAENLGDANAALRRESVLALGRLGLADDRAAVEALRGDPDPLVRAAAFEVLGEE